MKKISAVGVMDISDPLFQYLVDNVKTTQDLFYLINNHNIPYKLLSEVKDVFKSILSLHIRWFDNVGIFPIKLSNYLLQISKEHICLFGNKQGLLDVDLIAKSFKDHSLLRKDQACSCNYKKIKKLQYPSVIKLKETDLFKLQYGTKAWFDAFYSDDNWSIDDVKLGLEL